MLSNLRNSWAVAGTTFVVWALVTASAVYWGFKLAAKRDAGGAVAPIVSAPIPADPTAVARLLGANPAKAAPTPNLASRFMLVGVVASRSHDGAALIAVNGKVAKPFRVGSPVDEGLVLQSVENRRATLATVADGRPVVTLELPPLTK